MNLENEILQLCFDVLEKEITPWEAQKEILRLLDVVWRREQLPCDHSWKSRFNEKRGSYVICSKCSEER